MASTTLHLVHVTSLLHVRNAHVNKPAPPSLILNRRHCLLLTLTAATAAAPAKAEDIGLFGIRKRIIKAQEEVEEVVKEGLENAEKGLENVEKGLENAEKGFENAEKGFVNVEKGFEKAEIEAEVGFGAAAVQAAAVAGAEVVGVLVATSVVNGILGPEGQKL